MGTYIATLLVGTVLSVPQGSFPQVASSGSAYSSNTALVSAPFSGVRCQLQSTMQNGQVITYQVCQ